VGGMKTSVIDAIMAGMCMVGVTRCENACEGCYDVLQAATDE
jgi:hypothetical protein